MEKKIRCKTCEYLKEGGRSEAQACYSYGRKHYFCKHPDACKECMKVKRDYSDFVGYGDNTKESPLKLKTSPKWCPLKTNK